MSSALRQALEEAKQKLIEQERMIKELTSPPYGVGTVLNTTDDNTVLISSKNELVEYVIPNSFKNKLLPGRRVRFNSEYGTISGILPLLSFESGDIYTVKEVDGRYCEIDFSDSTRRVFLGEEKAKKGDRVVVDESAMVVIRNLGKIDKEHIFREETNTTWNDIGGLEFAKEQMIDAIEMPHRHPDIYKRYGKGSPKGVLLYGPPGCGKTMIGKAAATALANIHGQSASTGFIYVKGPEILRKYVGESEGIIRRLFSSAREHKEKNNYPAIIFIDEADAIMNRRGSGKSSDVERTIVPMFLAEMDGMNDSGAMVLLATNRPDILDPAVVREGRVDRKIEIPRPDRGASKSIADVHMKGKPIDKGYTVDGLIEKALDLMFDPESKITMSGAVIAGTVDYAVSSAISRDIHSGSFTGLREEDMEIAVERIRMQNMHVDTAEVPVFGR